MATLLVDSTVHIHWWRGRRNVVEWLALNASADLATSAISVAEIYTGAGPGAEDRWNAYFDQFTIVPVEAQVARLAGALRFQLARQGQQLSFSDGLIAAHALLNDWAVVTANVKDFAPTGVQIVEVR